MDDLAEGLGLLVGEDFIGIGWAKRLQTVEH